MTDDQYRIQTVDSLGMLELYADTTNKQLDAIGDILLSTGATIERLASINNVKQPPANKPSPDGKGSAGIAPIGGDIGKFIKSIGESATYYVKAKPHMSGIAKSVGDFMVELSNSLSNVSPEDAARANESLKSFGAVAGSIGTFGTNLAQSIPAWKIARPFVGFIGRTIAKLVNSVSNALGEKTDPKKAEDTGKALGAISGSILKTAGILALATPLFIIAAPGILAMHLTFFLLTKVAKLLADNSKDIKAGFGVLNQTSLSILAFAGSLALSAMIMSTVGSAEAGGLAVLFGGIGLAALSFSLVGKFKEDIYAGSMATLAMSGSVFIFSLAMAGSAALMSEVGIGALGMTMLALAGTALVFGLAGKFWEDIALGSLAFAAAGIALWIFAPQYERMAITVGQNPSALWQVPLAIVGIGAAFALAGAGPIPLMIALGAAAIAATGGALWIVASALEKFVSLPTIDDDKARGIESGIKAVVTGFGKSFEDLSLTEALTLPLKIPVVGLMGLALAGLGMGLGSYLNNAGKWTDENSDTLKYTIQSLSAAFAAAGSTEGMSKFFGFNVGENDVERGIESTMRIGRNLKGLAEGIMAWKNMALKEDDVQAIANNIGRVLNVIPGIFATIGQREQGSTDNMSFLGLTFENPFGSGDVEEGIESTMKMGRNLKELAEGIMAWKEMKISQDDLQTIATNVSAVLNTIPSIFATIGQREKGSTGKVNFFGLSFDNPFSEGDVEAGLEATEKLGGNLKTLADGVMAWKEGGKNGFSAADIPSIKNNILSILETIPSAFAAIGKADKSTEGLLWGDGDVERGVDLINDLAPSLKTISGLVTSFKDIAAPAKLGAGIGLGINYMLSGIQAGLLRIKDTDVERFIKIMKPLDKLAGTWKNINEQIKAHVNYLGKLDPKYIDNFSKWADGLKRLSEVDAARLEQTSGFSQKLTQLTSGAAFEQAPSTQIIEVGNTGKTVNTNKTTSTTKTAAPSIQPDFTKMVNLMEQLLQVMSTMAQNDAAQSQELAGIKSALNGTLKVRTKDGAF